jgi:hypothetical protein
MGTNGWPVTATGPLSNVEQLHQAFSTVSQALIKHQSLEQIAKELGISFGRLSHLLIYLIGRYGLLAHRVYWAIDPAARNDVSAIHARWPLLGQDPRNIELVLLRLKLPKRRREEILLASVCGHLLNINAYGLLANIEASLALLIRKELSEGFGSEWWRKGVPLKIRQACSNQQDEDPEPAEKWSYWTISHMVSILEDQWSIFSKVLPKSLTVDRKVVFSSLTGLNRLRNRIMHPIKGYVLQQDDFQLIDNVYRMIVYDYLSHRQGGPIPERIELDVG